MVMPDHLGGHFPEQGCVSNKKPRLHVWRAAEPELHLIISNFY